MADPVLLAPLSLQALVITANNAGHFQAAPADYDRVVQGVSSPGPKPFLDLDPDHPQPGGLAETGVYLHWVVPAALRHGFDSGAGLDFPPLPDQWLVVRFARHPATAAPVVAAWFIDAGLLADDVAESASLLWPDPTASGYAAHRCGRVYGVMGTKQAPPLSGANLAALPRVSGPLTAHGNATTGAASFSAAVADNRNVLSWRDSLADLGPIEGQDLAISYLVLGWHRDPAADPLRRTLTTLPAERAEAKPFDAVLEALGWDLPARSGEEGELSDLGDPRSWRCLYHGMVAHINYWSRQYYKGPELGRPGAGAAHGSLAEQPRPLTVGVGNNVADALAAVLADHAGENAAEPALWQFLEAVLYRQVPTLYAGWQETPREYDVHQSWFAPQRAGYRWTLSAPERDAATLAAGSGQKPGAAAQATPDQLKALRDLNQAQAEYNATARRVAALQQDTYARWWSMARAGAHMQHQFPRPRKSAFASEAQNLATFGCALEDAVTKALPAAARQVSTAFAALRAALHGSSLEVRLENEPRFWQPSDPVIVVEGVGRQDKHHQPGSLPCRVFGSGLPSALASAIDISNQDRAQWPRPAGPADLAAAAQPVFAGALATLGTAAGAVLGEAALVEQALTGLAVNLRDPSGNGGDLMAADWQDWAHRLHVDVTWREPEAPRAGHKGRKPAKEGPPQDMITLEGMDGKSGVAGEVYRLASIWGQQPWAPLYLDWQVTFHPLPNLASWNPTQYDYTPPATEPADDEPHTVRGRSLMAPVAGHFLKGPVKEAKLRLGQIAEAQKLNGQVDVWTQRLTEMEEDGLLGQMLSGFHQMFLHRSLLAPRIMPDRTCPWVVVDAQTKYADDKFVQDGLLAAPPLLPAETGVQADAGGEKALTMRSLGPTDPNSDDANLILPYSLLAAGSYTIDHLWVVDDFGQWVELAQASDISKGIYPSPHCAWPGAGARLALPPRIVQPARLDFRFVSGADMLAESDRHPDDQPICGWVYVNYLDRGLVIADRSGRLLGEVRLARGADGTDTRAWECLVKGQSAETTLEELKADETLIAFIAGLDTAAKLHDLMHLIDQRLAAMRTGTESHRFRLAGRPLALVNARLGLELFGSAWQDPLPGVQAAPPDPVSGCPGGAAAASALEPLCLPVELGYAGPADDGLIGYYVRRAAPRSGQEPRDLTAIVPPGGFALALDPDVFHEVDPARRYVLDPEKDCIAVTFAGPAVVTLLMDPNAPVNAWPRILPAKAITLPPEFVELARSQMELSIRVGPALLRRPWKAPAPGSVAPASAPPVSAPLPAPQGLAGKWFFRSPVAPDDLRVVAPETQATFDGALPLAAEGRLVLTTAPEPSTERSKEEVTQ